MTDPAVGASVSNNPDSSNNGRLIFVTGASRSGTTLMCRVLGNHSRILGLNELQFFGEFFDIDVCTQKRAPAELEPSVAMLLARQARDFWVEAPTAAEREEAHHIVAALPESERNGAGIYAATVAHLAAQAGADTGCEQTPRNIFYAARLLELYPRAQVVHMVRDPRAVLASQKNRWQMRKLGGKNVPWSEVIRLWFNYHPITMSSLWSRATQAALNLEQHPRFTLLRFEDLVANPEETVKDLCDWLDVSFEPGMLNVPQWGSSNIQHSSDNKGVSQDMVAKWRDVLTDGEIRISERRTGRYLERFNYPRLTTGKMSLSAWLQILVRYPIHLVGAVVTNPRRVAIQLKAILRKQAST